MEENNEIQGAILKTDFVRHRNALLVRGDLSQLFVDYYLHLADHGLKLEPAQDRLFKEALAAFTLHCASRPLNEHAAWTISFQEPRLNVFLAGDNEDCTVVGRVFTENVKESDTNIFYSDSVPRRGAEKRRSVVTFAGDSALTAAETYYANSEQRPARYFDLGDDSYAMLVSHPDCDEKWFESVTVEDIRKIDAQETVAPIEKRAYPWQCGCNQQKILGALAPVARTSIGELFGDAESIRVQCPRCAATHSITREVMEAYLVQSNKSGG